MIKVFYLITSSDFGGAETLVEQLVLSLDRKHFSPFVCSVKPGGRMLRRLTEAGVPTASLDFERGGPFMKGLRTAFHRLGDLLREVKPDVMHTSLFQADVLGVTAAVKCGVPVRFVTLHMVMRDRLWQLPLERALAPWVDRFLMVSRDLERFYRRWLFLPSNRSVVVYNGVDLSEIERRRTDAAELSNVTHPVVMGLGRLDVQKRWQDLLLAAATLRGPFTIVFVGDGPLRADLECAARENGLADRVRFVGFQGNPIPYLDKADVVVLPSGEEGLPLALLEAMALGKPVLATRVGAVPEVVEDGVTGYLVPAGRPQELAKALEKFLHDPGRRASFGAAGRLKVSENFARQSGQERIQTFYEAAVAARRAAP